MVVKHVSGTPTKAIANLNTSSTEYKIIVKKYQSILASYMYCATGKQLITVHHPLESVNAICTVTQMLDYLVIHIGL